jgi:hypothetical protein
LDKVNFADLVAGYAVFYVFVIVRVIIAICVEVVLEVQLNNFQRLLGLLCPLAFFEEEKMAVEVSNVSKQIETPLDWRVLEPQLEDFRALHVV